ncbi:MAG TPA: hypothetical protein PKI49_10555 [Pseudomonadota bacterium]|nr:hypothetical protein [Pseudomonadota bacterium]HNK47335.1 hypothetical protein [Pseudomonadota bacterium]HNN54457.1 hypothetical protein [Pseudomonadota bacterium]HNO68940.1 hypothetical protein [Pseudomonadota bacterium]
MRLRLAVVDESVSPLVESHESLTRQALLPDAVAKKLELLTGGWDFVGEQDGMRLFVAQQVPLELRIGQLLLRPPSLEDAQLRALLTTGLTASQSLHQISDERGRSLAGWPLRLLQGRVVNHGAWSGGDSEHRLVASYRFFEHSGEALLKVGNDSLLERCRDDLLALLRSGWPQFSPPVGVATIAELWQ